jgi:WD40 repeat protein/tRNA A-37 threonylcarbamoyl transferase component Bud32
LNHIGCPDTEGLDRLLAGELPARERDQVAAHLESCPRCQDRVEQLLADDSVLTWQRTMAARAAPGPSADFLKSMLELVPLVATSAVSVADTNGGPPTGAARDEPEPCPEQVGGYEVLGVLGRGGMSVVYKARQPGLGRMVALKRLSPREPHGPNSARFLREAAAAARMHHPNIVQVYEVGEDGGRPFLALEYLPGGTLAEYLGGKPADPREAAELLEKVARAVHHAHERGIIHRDLKPSNILLQKDEGRKMKDEGIQTSDSSIILHLSSFQPKVSDFGLARSVTEDQSLTMPDVLVGTPAYLAPEAIRQPGLATAAGDVYALGVILYEMLTGRPPLLGPTTLATLRLVEAAEPVPPRRLQPHLPRDLDTICLTCLCKDTRRRYPSALEVAEELRRFLDGRPIRARPVGALATGWLWCKRNPVVAGLGAALAVSVLLGLAVALVLLGQARQSAADAAASAAAAGKNETRALAAAARADANARLANDRAYASDLQFASQMWRNRQLSVLEDLLDGQRPERTDGTDRRGFEWNFLWASSHPPHRSVGLRGQGWDLTASPGGGYFAVAVGDPAVMLLDADGKPVRTLTATGAKVIRVAVSADGRRVAGGSEDGVTQIWETDSGRLLHTQSGHKGPVTGLRFMPDGGGTLVTVGLDGTLRVWNLDDRSADPKVIRKTAVRFHGVAVSPDGKRLAVGGSDGAVRLWDTATWVEQPAFRGHSGDVLSVKFAPDSVRLASGSRDHTARLWDTATGKALALLPVHLDAVFALDFSSDGRALASASLDRSVRVTDVASGLQSLTLLGHGDFVTGVAFGPDGKTLASTGWDQSVRLWDLTAGRPHRVWRGHPGPVRAAAFAPHGGGLATGSADGTVRVWDPTTGVQRQILGGHTGGVLSLAFDADGRRLATAAYDRQVRVWDVAAQRVAHTLDGHKERINDVSFGPGGRLLAGAGEGGSVYIWDAAGSWGCRELAKLPAAVACVRFDPTGLNLAAGCRDGTVTVLAVANGERQLYLAGHAGAATALDFSPDGRCLAVAAVDRAIRIWDGETGNLTHTLRGHVRAVSAVRFSPDGKRLFSGSPDQTVRVWHAGSGQPLVTLSEPDEVTALAVDPDGPAVASAGTAGIIGVRRASP